MVTEQSRRLSAFRNISSPRPWWPRNLDDQTTCIEPVDVRSVDFQIVPLDRTLKEWLYTMRRKLSELLFERLGSMIPVLSTFFTMIPSCLTGGKITLALSCDTTPSSRSD
jgi:hypothetical protein